MRDYKLVAQRVFQRRDAYLLAKKRKRRFIIYTAIPVSLCFLIAVSTGYRHLKNNSSDDLRMVEQETADITNVSSNIQETVSDNSVQTEQTEIIMTSSEKNNNNLTTITEINQPVSNSETIPTTELNKPKPEETKTNMTSTSVTEFSTEATEIITTAPEAEFTTEQTESHEIATQPPELQQPSDYRITVESFEPTPEQLSQVVQQTLPSHFENNYTTLEQLFQDTGATILCKVLSVVNTIRDNKPYTVYTVEVTESVYGSFVAGDLLSIVQYGGYVLQENDSIDSYDPEDSIPPPPYDGLDPPNNAMRPPSPDGELSGELDKPQSPSAATSSEILIEEQLAYSETPNISQEYVLFISPDSLFDGAYATLNQNEGVFKVNPETGELIRNAEQGEEINSVSYETVKEISQYFVDSTN
ncbi:MAG: hypothetical protein K2H66_05060 [Oscillospiraceae bacterium]|nr:hypothetical protein [Oscillospiraceae bacterium]